MSILQLVCRLPTDDVQPLPNGFNPRTYCDQADIDGWLELRRLAFAGLPTAVGSWSARDFEREFLNQPWWRPDRLLLVEPSDRPASNCRLQFAGAVSVVERRGATKVRWSVHWLAVAPAWRGQGIGRWLLAAAHRRAYDQGSQEIYAETHRSWTAAIGLYEQAGYRQHQPARREIES